MVTIRGYRPDDLPALYDICLTTGASGQDATALHSDRDLIGQLYAAPYGVLEPEQVLLAEDDLGVAGYIVGTFDTDGFAAREERDWWPALRQRYAEPSPALTAADRQRIAAIRTPERNPADIVAAYPAHIHMNLRSRLRGQGVGTMLLQRWVSMAEAAGVKGIHLGANASNVGGVAFWQRSGFVPLQTIGRTVWMGMKLKD
ncbi:GNAT family N-acetyltransferase [Devosia beringensis]|uniref:GNAT family N-acetyltransferase n=1 Tax=Devosia beringensis TaxID=2657486 RepID=UPI00186B616B|nr:GNAT family N-acetyltransferase [Devosia beringensis]